MIYSNSSDKVAIAIDDRLTPTENHETTVRLFDRPQVASRLRTIQKTVRREQAVEVRHGLCFLHANVDASEVGVVHAKERDELGGRIVDCDVVGYTEFYG